MADDMADALADLKEKEALALAAGRLESGEDPMAILDSARRGMETVGQRFASCEYFIPDLIYSGEILRQISQMLKPGLSAATGLERHGKVVIGTVAGDIHDIGKDIVAFMLDVSGFEVFDIGIDVPPQHFVDRIKETGAGIMALSGFLTLAFDSMKETIEAIKAAGLRDRVKVMIGGGQINEDIRRYTGADAWGRDAMAGVSLAREWTGGRENG